RTGPGLAGPGSVLDAVVVRDEAGDIDDGVPVIQRHEPNALGSASDHADLLDPLAVDHAVPGDEHELVVRQDFLDRDDLSGPRSDLPVDYALPAPALEPVVLDPASLPRSVLGHDDERCLDGGVLANDDQPDDVGALVEYDPSDAGRRAPLLARVALVESDRLPVACREDDLVIAFRDLDVDQLVALFDVDRIDADDTHVAVRAERGLLHDA